MHNLVQTKKWPRYIVMVIVVVFVFKNPVSAAHMVNQAGGLITQGANALGRFAGALHAG